MRKPGTFANILLTCASILVGLVMIELVARIFVDIPAPYPIEPELLQLERDNWVLRPSYEGVMDNGVDFENQRLSVDELGMRRVACQPSLATDAPRIYILGDSQTFGFGLSDADAWPSVVQCALADAAGNPPLVLNMGVFAINTDQYIRRLEGVILPTLREGDIVVISVTWNDMHTDVSGAEPPTVKFVGDDPADIEEVFTLKASEPLQFIPPRTWRYDLYLRTGVFVPSFGGLKEFAATAQFVSAIARYMEPRLRLAYYRFRSTDALQSKLSPTAFESNIAQFRAASEVIRSRGGIPVLHLLPNRLFYDQTYYDAYSRSGQSFPAQDYLGYITQDFCDSDPIICINPFDRLKTDVSNAHSFAFDGHYNAEAARLIAENFVDSLRQSTVMD